VQRNSAYRDTIFTGLELSEEKLLNIVAALNICPVISTNPERAFCSHKLIFLTNTTNWLQKVFTNTQ